MFRNMFDPNSGLMIVMGQITDCILLSLLWVLCCFPVVTVGAASAALYDSVYHVFCKGDKNSWQRFFSSFRKNLKSSVVSTVLFLLISVAMGWGMIQIWNAAVYGRISWAVFSAAAFFAFVLSGILSLMFPLFSRFETTAARLWGNTFRLGIANMPLTIGLAAVNLAALFLYLRFVFPLFFLPALAAMLSGAFIEPMLKPYMPGPDEGGEQ